MPSRIALFLALPPFASGLQEVPAEGGLTLEEVRDLARRSAPAVLAARERIEEARGRLRSASIALPGNPSLDLTAGPRLDRGDRTTDVDVSVSIPFSTAGKRSHRIDSAEADVAAEAARAEDAVRLALAEASRAFYQVLLAEERIRFAEERLRIDEELVATAERRERAGLAAAFEVQLAGVEAGRSRSEVAAARAARVRALSDLGTVLGSPPDRTLSVRGDLRDRRRFGLEALLENAGERPDLRALAAEVRRAKSDVDLASARKWPDLSLLLGYERDEGADVFRAGVAVPLPLVDRGEGTLQEARARAARSRTEYDSTLRVARGRLRGLWEGFGLLEESVRSLEEEALPRLEEAQRFARGAYEGGYLPLPQWLAVRREILETRTSHLHRLFETAIAGLELELEAGALR
jgi:outer membrane protein, heavy metal efflux system